MEKNKPFRCKCGAAARIRYKDPYVWVECKNKCGNKSGYHFVFLSTEIEKAEEQAIASWNKENGNVNTIINYF